MLIQFRQRMTHGPTYANANDHQDRNSQHPNQRAP
jgi:hypothetical protein